MALFSAYLDDSGTHSGGQHGASKIVVSAGIVVNEEQTIAFDAEWRKVTEPEGLPFFHMAHFVANNRPYNGWTKEKKNNFLGNLVNIVHDYASLFIYHSIPTADLKAAIGQQKNLESIAYQMCCQSSIIELCKWVLESTDRSKLAVFIERGRPITNDIQIKTFREIKGRDLQGKFRIQDIALAEKQNHLPLQGADLFAYIVYRYYDTVVQGIPPYIRVSWESIIQGRELRGYAFTPDRIRKELDPLAWPRSLRGGP